MGGEHFRRPVLFIETAHGEKFDEPRAVDARQDLSAVLVRTKFWPFLFHHTEPEGVAAVEDHAVGPDLDAAVKLNWLRHDECVDDGGAGQAGYRDPLIERRGIRQYQPCGEPG